MLLFVLLAFGGSYYGALREYRSHGSATTPVSTIIAKGTPTLEIGRQLQAAGVIHSAWSFAVAEHVFTGKPLKAGEYMFPAQATLAGVIAQMRAGQVVVHHLTIPEGLTNFQIKFLVESEPSLTGSVGTMPGEGRLMPDTYVFSRNDTRASLIQRMHEAEEKTLADAWAARDQFVALDNPEEALTLASIVEKETGVAAERPKVAAVFYNRMAKDIPLQSDPTIIYVMSNRQGSMGRPLGHHDLAFESPYNSYVHQGLPPGPICNPGRASIEAVLHPDKDDFLYFVATGEGGHAFAATLAEHNRNVARYIQVMKDKTGK